jgi:hypothetical protein
MVDVQFAVDALLMASRGLFGSCTLLTGDLDFKPLVTALVEMGVNVHLLYPEDETNDDLKAAADSVRAMTIDVWQEWLSPSQSALLPSVGYIVGAAPTHSNVLRRWRDDKHGGCYVAKDESVFELITNPPSGRPLRISSSNEHHLMAYAKDKFGIIAP